MTCNDCPYNNTEDCQILYANGVAFYCRGLREGIMDDSEDDTEASGKASFNCSAPDCLDCERNDECNHIGLFEEASE